MVKMWSVEIERQITLYVLAPTEADAEALGCDSLGTLRVADGWKDCVTIHDEWMNVQSVTEKKVN